MSLGRVDQTAAAFTDNTAPGTPLAGIGAAAAERRAEQAVLDRSMVPMAAFLREAKIPQTEIPRLLSILPDQAGLAAEIGRILGPQLPLMSQNFSRAKLLIRSPDGLQYREILDGGLTFACGLDTISHLFPLRGSVEAAGLKMEFRLAFVYQSSQGFGVDEASSPFFCVTETMDRLLKTHLSPLGWCGYEMQVWRGTPRFQVRIPLAPEMLEVSAMAGFGRVLSLLAEAHSGLSSEG